MMEKKRSKGFLFWGLFIMLNGIVDSIFWLRSEVFIIEKILLTVFLIALGIGVLKLKEWVRIPALLYVFFLAASGVKVLFDINAENLSVFTSEGLLQYYLLLASGFFRLCLGIGAMSFFGKKSVQAQLT